MVATPSAIAAESCHEPVLQGGLCKHRYSRCNCTDPRRLKALAQGTQQVLTRTFCLRYSMLRNYRVSQPPRKLDHQNAPCRMLHGMEWRIDARNRRFVPCVCFGHAHKRVPRSFRAQKVFAIVHYTARATPGATRTARPTPIKMHHLDQNTSPKRLAHAQHHRKKTLHT